MTLQSYLNKTLELLLGSQNLPLITTEQIIHSIDLTLLDEQASQETLFQIKQKAQLNQIAALCIYSKHLPLFHQLNTIPLATVVNFPQGNEKEASILTAITNAVELGATEIDYVLPYQLYLSGKKEETLSQCQTIINFCTQQKLTLKIILETGAFPELQSIYEVSKNLISLGCNFLKTSTGKISQGASLPAVFTILSAINDMNKPCGIKISGGIKTPLQAFNYAKLAELMMGKPIDKSWFRIGASNLLSTLKNK